MSRDFLRQYVSDIGRKILTEVGKVDIIPEVPTERETIYQNDPEFNAEIREFGCCFMSLLWLIDHKKNLDLMTHEGVTALFNQAKRDRILGDECFLQNPQGLCDYFISSGKILYKGWAPSNYKCSDSEVEQLVFHWEEKGYTHFVAGNGSGLVIYDPINYGGQGSNTVKYGYLESKRVYQWEV